MYVCIHWLKCTSTSLILRLYVDRHVNYYLSCNSMVTDIILYSPHSPSLPPRNPSAQPVISNPVLTSPPPKHLSSPSPPLEQSKEESPPPGPFSSADVPLLSPLVISPSMMAPSAFSTKSHIEQG